MWWFSHRLLCQFEYCLGSGWLDLGRSEGLKLAWNWEFKKVMFVIEFTVVFLMVSGTVIGNHESTRIVKVIFFGTRIVKVIKHMMPRNCPLRANMSTEKQTTYRPTLD